MRRLTTLYIAMFLSLISLCSAQQQNHPSTAGSQNISSPGLVYIQNTTSPQTANFDITGNGVVWGTLQGNFIQGNKINNYGAYQVGGTNVLSIGLATDGNLFVGSGAGPGTVQGAGQGNAFLGYQTGYHNTTGFNNVFSGAQAGFSNTTGGGNVYAGFQAGYSNQTNGHNTAIGSWAGFANIGYANTFLGDSAGSQNTTGSSNVFVGFGAGSLNFSGNNDIYIGTYGPESGSEDGAIRIGNQNQSAAFISGIYGTNVHGNYVYISANGQLGTASSSRRFKEQIKDMGDSTDALMKLRPVTFLYKPEFANGDRTLQYGLIAEEVAEIYPDLVSYEKDGKTPYTVRYQYLASMLLNEVQKQYHRADEQGQLIESQQKQIEGQRSQIEVQRTEITAQSQQIENLKQELQLQNASMQERMSKLESLVDRKTTVARK